MIRTSKYRNRIIRLIESRVPAEFSTVLDLVASLADPVIGADRPLGTWNSVARRWMDATALSGDESEDLNLRLLRPNVARIETRTAKPARTVRNGLQISIFNTIYI